MDDLSLPLFAWARNHEDYTGAVCWAILNRQKTAYLAIEALVDVEDFDRVKHLNWRISRIGKNRKWRVNRGTKGETFYLARELMDFPSGLTVDHRDRNSLNDRRSNLRVCTIRENNLNRPGNHTATSRYKGVAWSTKQQCWKVITGPKSAKVYVGAFQSEIEAARAYNEYAKKHFGPFAYLNPV